jgi:hypothetical protein
MTIYLAGHWFMLIVHWRRASQFSTFLKAFGLYLGFRICMTCGMLIYHTQLMVVNLSTNEHLNLYRYEYLWTQDQEGAPKKYRNPYFKGWWGNIMDRMFPSESCYLLPDDQNYLLSSTSLLLTSNVNFDGQNVV